MTNSERITAAFVCLLIINCASAQPYNFDSGWKFYRGDVKEGQSKLFNDSEWRTLDLPHDWSIEDLPGTSSPFSIDAPGKVSTGYTTGGTGWYRKRFFVPEEWKTRNISILFDGVYMNAEVWVNGKLAGTHDYGYTSFSIDISRLLKPGPENVVAVRVENRGRNSRWYSGSGIYRHVWLNVRNEVHAGQWGIRVTSKDEGNNTAGVMISASIINSSGVPVMVKIKNTVNDEKGKTVLSTESSGSLRPGSQAVFKQEGLVTEPVLWSTEQPSLYDLVTEIYSDGRLSDSVVTKFGIRYISFSVTGGFTLNGKSIKLRGGCVHHDNGPLGAKALDRAEERRVMLLKENGFNAIRCSHNPPSPAFLDACDRAGMLVIDEAFDMWKVANNPDDYHLYFDRSWESDIESMVSRDFNHPSIILWSIGNEIRDMEKPEIIEVGRRLAAKVRSLDTTRPVTAAVNNLRPGKDGFFSILDVCGYNYAAGGDHGVDSLYRMDHERQPSRIMVGTESYPYEAFSSWMSVLDNPFVAGDFVWTAFDYIGEASIGWMGYWQEEFFPWNLAFCGDLDICGWKRPQSYYRDALWKKDMISVFVSPPEVSFPINPNKQSWSKWGWDDVVADWTWKGFEGKILKVSVYSSSPEAELFLNGRSLGKKRTDRSTRFIAEWNVPYEPGELKATGSGTGSSAPVAVLRSADRVSSVSMEADRTLIKADGQDLSYVTVELTDNKGITNPKAEDLVSFRVEGEGTIEAVGNACPVSLESNTRPERKAWHGKCLVIVRSTRKAGVINLTAGIKGLPDAVITINTEAVQ